MLPFAVAGTGFGGYADCLVDGSSDCRYALSFGFHYFCQHPEREEIIARTKASTASEDSLPGA